MGGIKTGNIIYTFSILFSILSYQNCYVKASVGQGHDWRPKSTFLGPAGDGYGIWKTVTLNIRGENS